MKSKPSGGVCTLGDIFDYSVPRTMIRMRQQVLRIGGRSGSAFGATIPVTSSTPHPHLYSSGRCSTPAYHILSAFRIASRHRSRGVATKKISGRHDQRGASELFACDIAIQRGTYPVMFQGLSSEVNGYKPLVSPRYLSEVRRA